MNPRDLLTFSHDALRTAAAGVTDWTAPSPCAGWTVAQVLQHAVGDQIGYAAMLDGGAFPAEDPFQPSGALDGDPVALVDVAVTRSAAAFRTIADDAEAVPNPLPHGPLPMWLASGACALDAAVHAWDIATGSGQPSPLTAEAARDLHAVSAEIVEPLRQWGAYAPAIEPATDADDVTRLLNYLGRDA